MSLIEDALEGGVPRVALGLGLVVAAPVVLPAVAAGARPVAKTLVRGYLVAADSARRVASRTREEMSDIVAEVRHEHEGDGEGRTPRTRAKTTEASAKKA
jgi:hypothetical protein